MGNLTSSVGLGDWSSNQFTTISHFDHAKQLSQTYEPNYSTVVCLFFYYSPNLTFVSILVLVFLVNLYLLTRFFLNTHSFQNLLATLQQQQPHSFHHYLAQHLKTTKTKTNPKIVID